MGDKYTVDERISANDKLVDEFVEHYKHKHDTDENCQGMLAELYKWYGNKVVELQIQLDRLQSQHHYNEANDHSH